MHIAALSPLPKLDLVFWNLPSPYRPIKLQHNYHHPDKHKASKKCVQHNFRGTLVNGFKKAARNSQAKAKQTNTVACLPRKHRRRTTGREE